MFADRTNWNLEENRLTRALANRRATGGEIFDLTLSNPTACGFSYNEHAILSALADPGAMLYSPDPHGLPRARAAVAEYYAEIACETSADDILITTGTSEAYSFLFRMLCNPGDEILIPTPSYPLFDFLADIQDVRLVRYPLLYDHGWHIDLHGLRQAISSRTRAMIVVHPNNPTGSYAKEAERTQLAEISAQHELALIADEVFLDFAFGERAGSFAGQRNALTFALSGLSKLCGLPQMKAGWIVATGPDKKKREALLRLEVIADTYLSMNAPVQHALPALLAQRHSFHRQCMVRTKQNLNELDRLLASHEGCSRLQLEGGWNAVIQIPAIRPDEDAAIDLLESRGAYVYPGHFYDFPRDGHMVVSLLVPPPVFSEGIARLLAFF